MLVDPKECLCLSTFFLIDPFGCWGFCWPTPNMLGENLSQVFRAAKTSPNGRCWTVFFWTANFRCFCRMTSFSLEPCRLEDLPSGSVFSATVTCERIRFYGMKITIFSTTIFGIDVWHFCPTTGFQANLRRLSSYRYMHMDPMRRMLLKQVLGWITALHWG